jgi:hypothetical protein
MIEFVLMAEVLAGTVSQSTCEGRIGVRVNYSSGKILRIYQNSPAAWNSLHKNDVVLEVDGKKDNCENISGNPGSFVHLKVKRVFEIPAASACEKPTEITQIFELDIERIERWKIGI